MSTTVDERVVSMQFDNKQFENNVQTSLSTLEKLKQSLNLTGAAKGLENVDAASKNIDMSGLSNAVQTVHAKFSALGVMGVTALANITNSAVNAGKRIVSALTIDPIKMGFSEYETQINAVQTILANTSSKGTTIKDVNKALDTLNEYADKTIYNFTEMTRNIGTFTAAGIELDTATSAIQGIANLAAVSGSTSQQASTAMYQLSQALASGTVKLQDWNSVVNAGMGGQVFQDALKRTAKVMGTNVDKIIKDAGSFRESLKEGWITTDVLTETLNQFTMCAEEGTKEWEKYKKSLKEKGYTDKQAEEILKMGKTATEAATKVKTLTQLWDTLQEAAQSGWTQSWEIIVGDFEEAKVLFTEVSDTIGAMLGESAEARNEMLQGWKDLGGRTALINSVRNAFNGVMDVIAPIKEAFRDIFPPITSKQLFNLTKGLEKLTEKFKIGKTTADNLKRTFKGVFALFDIGVQAVKAIFGGFADLVGLIAPAGDGLLGFTANLGDGIVKFNEFIKTSDVFNKVIKGIGDVLKLVVSGVSNFASNVADAFKVFAGSNAENVEKFAENLKTRFEPLTKIGEFIKNVFSSLGAVLQKLSPIFKGLASLIGNAFGGLLDAFANAEFNSVLDFVNTGLLGGLIIGIKKFVDSLTGITDGAGGFLKNITDILDGVKGSLEAYQSSLKSKTLLQIAGAIGILAASLLVISLIDSKKLATSLAAIAGLFGELMASMTVFNRMTGTSKDTMKTCTAMIAMSISVAILATAMKKIGDLNLAGVVKGLIGIEGLTTILIATARAMNSESSTITKFSGQMILMSAAVGALALVARYLSKFTVGEMLKGGAGLYGIINMLVTAAKKMDSNSAAITKFGGQMILMSIAVGALSVVAKLLSTLSLEGLAKAGSGIFGMIAMLVAAAERLDSKDAAITKFGGQMILMSIAVGALSAVAKLLSTLSLEELGKAGAGIFGMIAMLVTAAKILDGEDAAITQFGGQMILMSIAIGALSLVAKMLSSFSWEELIKAGVGLLGIIGMLVAASKIMASGYVFDQGAGQMLIMSAAIGILAASLKLLAGLSIGEIIKSLFTLASAFAIIGVASLMLQPIIPAILGLAGAFALMGVAVIGIGAGLAAVGAGLTVLSAGLASIASVNAGIITKGIELIGIAIVELCNVIVDAAPAICVAIAAVLTSVIAALTATIPPLLECLGLLLTSLLDFLVSNVPKLVEAGMKLLLGILQGIADNIEEVVKTAIDIVTNFIDGISDGLPDVIQSGIDLMLSFINGMADGIRNNTDATIDAVDNLMDAIIGAIKKWFGSALTKGKELVGELIDGVDSKVKDAKSAAKDIIEDMIKGIKEKFESFKQAGKDLIDGFKKGIKEKASSVVESAKGVVSDALQGAKNLLGIKSPSKKFAEVGKWSDMGIVVGLKAFANKVSSAAKDVGRGALDSMRDSISGIADVITSNMNAEPTIRPILDLSKVKSGVRSINGMFTGRTLTVNTQPVGAVSASMQRLQNRQSSNNDLISAIEALHKDLTNMPRNSYNINGISVEEGSDAAAAIKAIVRFANIDGRS